MLLHESISEVRFRYLFFAKLLLVLLFCYFLEIRKSYCFASFCYFFLFRIRGSLDGWHVLTFVFRILIFSGFNVFVVVVVDVVDVDVDD